MEDKKRVIYRGIIIFLLAVIVVLIVVKRDFIFTKESSNDNTKLSVVYEKDNIKVAKDKDDNYYLNNNFVKKIEQEEKFEVKEVIGNDFVIVDEGLITENYVLYNKNGQKISFPEVEKVGPAYMTYENNKLTIVGNMLDDNVEDTICTFKPLDTIVYIKQEATISNGSVSTPKTVETKTLSKWAKDVYNKDCSKNTILTKNEVYTKYLTNLKNNIVKNYKVFTNNQITSKSKILDTNYTFIINKNLELLFTMGNKYTNYKISNDVLNIFLINTGNGGYSTLYFIKSVGSLHSMCIECINDNNKITINKEKYTNIVNVIQGDFSDGYSGAPDAIFIDIEGNMYSDNF